jgi:uncharacterized membrane protein
MSFWSDNQLWIILGIVALILIALIVVVVWLVHTAKHREPTLTPAEEAEKKRIEARRARATAKVIPMSPLDYQRMS